MKKTLLLTDVDFWRKDAGRKVRIVELVDFLSAHTHLTVVYIGAVHKADDDDPGRDLNYSLIFLEKKARLDPYQTGNLLQVFSQSHAFDCCIVEYIHLSFYLHYVPAGMKVILDTHDIAGQHSEMVTWPQQAGDIYKVSKETETQLFSLYHYIMVICEPDFATLQTRIPEGKLLLCPHPASVVDREIRPEAKNIGFVGSRYSPNKDAIQYFCHECWPLISQDNEVHLNIYGKVISLLDEVRATDTIHLKGWVGDVDQIYGCTDIIINPVRMGAGLKIKNIEALANGLPLVTTSHGARGLEMAANEAFLVADNPDDFAACVTRLIRDGELRKKISRNARCFILEQFSLERCFRSLLKAIDNN